MEKMTKFTFAFLTVLICLGSHLNLQAQNQTTRYEEENRDRTKGMDEKLHHDANGRIRPDLYKRSISAFQSVQIGQAAHLGATVDWVQIGPSPATVNDYLAGNGQRPGPNGSAIIDLVIDPSGSSDMTVYAIVNDGGVWKTTDGGKIWKPTTDKLGTLSFGALAMDPSDPKLIYAGTGNIFNNGYFKAIGIYVTHNAGESWNLLSGSSVLEKIGINKMLVPKSGTILVASRSGLYRSDNSGTSFATVSIDKQSTGYVTDLDVQGGGQNIWVALSGKGIYKSTDYGATFGENLWGSGHGSVPTAGSFHFVSLALSSDGQTIYANAGLNGGGVGVYKSTDGGANWSDISAAANKEEAGIPDWRQVKNCQCGYDQTMGVDPQNPNRVYMGFQDLWRSEDGGKTWKDVSYNSDNTKELMHVDHHALTFSPIPHRSGSKVTGLWVGNDGGVWSSADAGKTWADHNADTDDPAKMSFATNLFRGIGTGRGSSNNQWTYGGMQDTGTAAGQSTNAGEDKPQPWNEWGGGDGGQAAVNWDDPKKAYGQWGGWIIYTHDGGQSYARSNMSCSGNGNAASFQSIETSPTTGHVYIGGKCDNTPTIFVSTDDGENFTPYYSFTHATGDVWSIAVTPEDASVLFATVGTVVYRLKNDGGTVSATNVGIPNTIQGQSPRLAVNQKDANLVVAVFPGYSGESLPNPSKHVYFSDNAGQSWRDISGRIKDAYIPDMPIYSAVFDANTYPPSILVASDLGVFRTYDLGLTWHVAGVDLPNVHTVDLEIDTKVQPSLVKAGTYGRSTWQSTLPVDGQVFGQISANAYPATNISWKNDSNEALTISWVSGKGEQHEYATVAAKGSVGTIHMYYTGVSVVKDKSGNIVLCYVVNNLSNQEVVISQEALDKAKANKLQGYPGLRSYPSEYTTDSPDQVNNFLATNNSSQTLDLFWIDRSGNYRKMSTLKAGESTTVGPVFFGGTFSWNTTDGKLVGVYVASKAAHQNMDITDALIKSWD